MFFGGDPLSCSSLLRLVRFLLQCWRRLTDAQKNMQDPPSPRLRCPRSGQAQTPARTWGVDTTPQAPMVERSPIFAPSSPANTVEVTPCLLTGGECGQAWWKRSPSPFSGHHPLAELCSDGRPYRQLDLMILEVVSNLNDSTKHRQRFSLPEVHSSRRGTEGESC